MTLKELKKKTSVRWCSCSQYEVTITYRGKTYKCKSNNSLAWDRLDDENYPDNYRVGFYTNKGAWQSFYNECLFKNFIGKYKY